MVSRLLNNDAKLTVREETRQAVLEAVRELDFVPNSTATALRKSRTDTIGLVLKNVASPMVSEIVLGAQQVSSESGCVLVLMNAHEAEAGSPSFWQLIKAHRVDGLLLQGGYGPGDQLLSEYAGYIPSVIVNSAGTGQASGVRLQDDVAAQIATEHLLELGHREIVFIAGEPSAASDIRAQGFRSALAAAGEPCDDSSIVPAGWEASEGFDAASRVFASGRRPTAFAVANPSAAIGVFAAVQRAGLRIPDDVSVIAVNDMSIAPYLGPALSTVRLPLFELGKKSAAQLLAHMATGKPPDLVIKEPAPQLVLRGSTRRR